METLIVDLVCSKFNPDIIFLFGSFIRGETHTESDIDIAFLGKQQYCEYEIFLIAQQLAEMLGKEVDLVDLGKSSTIFKAQVVKTGEIIYCIDENLRDVFVIKTIMEYEYLEYDRKGIIDNIEKTGRVYND